ncbi:MAG TPA: DUF4339 domain-containing protein [Chthoniobacteraceae bacterium]|jgi:hypothetical protein|nr:DUF4339 domain-containing protein [Chthoniobacteraceae bacterium]
MNETLYYLSRADVQSGPFTLSQLRSMWQTGSVTADATYRFDPAAEWQPLTNLRRLLERPLSPTPVRPVATASNESLVLPIAALVLACLPLLCFAGLVCAHIAFARKRTANDSAPRVLTIIALVVGYLMALHTAISLVGMLYVTMSMHHPPF